MKRNPMSLDLDSMIDRRRLKRRLSFWRLIAIVAVAALAIWALTPFGVQEHTAHVARISVDDVIIENRETETILDRVAADPNVKALIVRINSPGGTTAGSEGLYHAIRRVGKQKPVVATMGTLAASGGYMASLAADHVIARETTITGSIGVIFQTAEMSGLLDKIGVGVETVKSGKLKGEPAVDKPMSPEARAALQAMIDDTYNWFVDLVAARRPLAREDVIPLADGRVFTGRQAAENGLVDALGGELEARQWLEQERGIPTALPVIDKDITPQERLLGDMLGSFVQKILSSEELTLDGMVSLWHPNR